MLRRLAVWLGLRPSEQQAETIKLLEFLNGKLGAQLAEARAAYYAPVPDEFVKGQVVMLVETLNEISKHTYTACDHWRPEICLQWAIDRALFGIGQSKIQRSQPTFGLEVRHE